MKRGALDDATLSAIEAPHTLARSGPTRLTTPRRSAQHWFAGHELRTPLQAIKGGVELLLEERGKGLSALQVEALGLITEATAELERCVALLGELAAEAEEPAAVPEPEPLGDWFARPEIQRYLTLTGQLPSAAAALEVVVAPATAARALACLASLAANGKRVEPLVCALTSVEPETCGLDLSTGNAASGNGAIARQLAARLFERAGISVQQSGVETTTLTLRRAA